MSTETHRFQIGGFHCIAVNDGHLMTGSITDFYPNAPLEELKLAQQPFLVSPSVYAYPFAHMWFERKWRFVGSPETSSDAAMIG